MDCKLIPKNCQIVFNLSKISPEDILSVSHQKIGDKHFTHVEWYDGDITTICREEEGAVTEKDGFLLCVAKKVFSNDSDLKNLFEKWC